MHDPVSIVVDAPAQQAKERSTSFGPTIESNQVLRAKLCRKSLPIRLAASPRSHRYDTRALSEKHYIHMIQSRTCEGALWYMQHTRYYYLHVLLGLQASHGRGEVFARQLPAEEVVGVMLYPAHGHIPRGLGELAVEPDGDVF